jgi:hypothetical protein
MPRDGQGQPPIVRVEVAAAELPQSALEVLTVTVTWNRNRART